MNGPEDVPRVGEIIRRYELLPLHAWGAAYRPPEVPLSGDQDLRESMLQVAEMGARNFLRNLAMLMARNPPAAADAPMLEEMARIGIHPGRVDESLLSSLSDEELDAAKAEALKEMKSAMFSIGRKVNGWNISLQNMGSYGTHYLTRVTVALFGLGANLPEDAVYPSNPGVDADGQPLESASSYQIHFAPDQIPPVHAFWSLTMYDEKGFLVENPISRYALGDRDPLTFNQDGSLDLWIQRGSPGPAKESNWLPCPVSGGFAPTLRLYWPKDAVLSGAWQPPGIQRLG